MEYKDERSDALRLHLFRGEVELDAFPVIRRSLRQLQGFDVDAAIIGASHAVQIRIGAETITEVLACRVEAVDRFADRLEGVWRLGAPVDVTLASGAEYACGCEPAPLGRAEARLEQLRQQIQLSQASSSEEPGSIGLTFQFPQRTERTPETLVRVSLEAEALRIHSAHVYPGEDLAVFSETVVRAAALGLKHSHQLVEVG